jgi:hypothetical protein
MSSNRIANSDGSNVIKREAAKIFEIQRPCDRKRGLVECKSKSDPVITRGNRNHLRIIHRISKLYNWIARNQLTTENSRIWALRSYFGKSANVKVQNIQHGK